MLLIDGEKADLKGKSSSEKQIAAYKLKLDKEYGWPVVFKFPDKLFKQTSNGSTESPCAKRISPRIPFNSENGAEEIIYCKRYWHDANKDIVMFPNKIVIDKILTVKEEDWDLAVYLAFFSKSIGRSYVILNAKKDAEDKHQLYLQETKVRSYIHTPEEKGLSEDALRRIAYSYGIDAHNIQIVQNSLWEAVRKLQLKSKTSYKDFLNLLVDNERIDLKANIHIAIKQELIKDFEDQSQTWAFVGKKGELGRVITRYKSNALEELEDYLVKNNKEYKNLCNTMGDLAVGNEK